MTKYTRTVTDVFYECIKDCPSCVKGDVYPEHKFIDSEYDCFSLYDPNDYPEYFKRIEKERKETCTQQPIEGAGNLSELLCAISPIETPFLDNLKKNNEWIREGIS